MSNETDGITQAAERWDAQRRELVPANPPPMLPPGGSMLGDRDENEWMAKEERPIDEHPEPYLCPDILWHGVFEQVADIVQKRTWEVWMGTACAIGALAHRNIHVRYHANLYGWMYGLLISPTGTGKSVCTDICEALLPTDYHIDTSVQSGPGLASILADIEREKGQVVSVDSHPAILILPEWTTVAKNLKIQNATLAQDLNSLFDGKDRFTISRSEASKTGGGRLEIPRPSLSICATTTESMFHEEVTSSMVRSGFLNRYLILPGSHVRWKLEDPTSGIDYDSLRQILPTGQPYGFGFGADVWRMYDPDAHDYFLLWGKPLFEDSIMNLNGNGVPTDDVFKRLHVYAHKVAMLYAWSERSPLIQLRHAMAAKVVVMTSLRFLRQILDNTPPELTPHLKTQKRLEELVLSQIPPGGGSSREKIVDNLKRHWGRPAVAAMIDSLIKIGALTVELGGERGTKKRLIAA